MEPDLDDTRPGLTPALDAFIKKMGLDVEDTVVGAPAPQQAPAEPPAAAESSVEPDLSDTAPIEPRVSGAAASFGFRIGTSGAPVPIDAVFYIGRRPSTPRITGGALPTLITVDSPQQLVSSTHLQLRQEGSTVVVTDLRSTNGSVVTVPGREPRTLLQGESLVVSPGTLIDIGDDNVVEIVSLGRLRAPEPQP